MFCSARNRGNSWQRRKGPRWRLRRVNRFNHAAVHIADLGQRAVRVHVDLIPACRAWRRAIHAHLIALRGHQHGTAGIIWAFTHTRPERLDAPIVAYALRRRGLIHQEKIQCRDAGPESRNCLRLPGLDSVRSRRGDVPIGLKERGYTVPDVICAKYQ